MSTPTTELAAATFPTQLGRNRLWLRLLAATLLLPVAGFAQTWTGASSTTWSTGGNWTGGVPGNTATATFNSNTANDPNLTANATVGKLLFSVGSDAETFTGSMLTLNGVSSVGIDNQSGVTQTFNNTLYVAAAQTWTASSGDLTFSAVTLNNNLTLTGSTTFSFGGTFVNRAGNRIFTNDSSGTVTLSGGVSLSHNNTGRTLTFGGTGNTSVTGAIGNGGTSAGNILKTGTGTLTLSGANTYTGTTTIGTANGTSGGTLSAGAANVLSGSTTTIYAGTLDLNGNNDTIGSLTLGGGASGTTAAVTTGAGTLTLGGNVTYTATNNPNGATISGNLALGGADRTFTVGDSSGATNDLTVSAVVSGGNAVIKAGTGTLVFSGANSYTGTTTVSGGILNIQNSSALGTTAGGTVVNTGNELQVQGGIAVGAETLSVTGSGTGSAGALRNVSGTNTWSGAVTLTGTTQIYADAGSLTLSGGITGTNQSLTLDGAGDFSLGAITTGTGTLTKNGSGMTTLTGTNTYTGATTINAGTLQLGASNALSDSTAVSLASGATFDLNGFTDTIATLAGTGGTVDLGGGSLTTAGAGSTTYSGMLTGGGSFTKQGAGVLTLDSTTDFSFNGTFNLEGGTLRLSDLALTVTTLNITGNSIIDFTGVSSLNVGTLNIVGSFTLTIQNWANASDFFFAQNWTGASYNITGASPMNLVTFNGATSADTKWLSYEDNAGSGYHQITPVPEPATYGALLLVASGGLLGWRRRLSRRDA